MKKLPQGEEIHKLARDLGVYSKYDAGAESEEVLQAKVLTALRERRDSRTWIIALVSAIASVLSALAAWCAILLAMSRIA
jgi:hypothetical protein